MSESLSIKNRTQNFINDQSFSFIMGNLLCLGSVTIVDELHNVTAKYR
jgi:hypothetical protein